jgi:flavin reductase (DIM6/NTAB) family NADH-FMN oxidoreductase RutF
MQEDAMKVEIPLGRANRLINPGPVVLVTARDGDRAGVMPAAWAVPLSKSPPLVGLALSTRHFTHDLIKRSQQFALNVPGLPLAETVVKLGSVSGWDVGDKFAPVDLRLTKAQHVEAPLIDECLAWLECTVVDTFQVGDHSLFVGQVLGAWVEEDAFEQTWLLDDDDLKPLHHLGGDVFAVLEQRLIVR